MPWQPQIPDRSKSLLLRNSRADTLCFSPARVIADTGNAFSLAFTTFSTAILLDFKRRGQPLSPWP